MATENPANWRYHSRDYGVAEALDNCYPVTCRNDEVLRTARAQIRVAEAAIKFRMQELADGAPDAD